VAYVAALEGQRGVLKFAAAPQNREQIARLIQSVTGVQLRVEPAADEEASPPMPGSVQTPASTSRPATDMLRRVMADPQPPHASSSAVARSLSQEDRRQLASLPLVRMVMEHFDARIVDARPEREETRPSDTQAEPIAESHGEDVAAYDADVPPELDDEA
jgi:hypothetical protein